MLMLMLMWRVGERTNDGLPAASKTDVALAEAAATEPA